MEIKRWYAENSESNLTGRYITNKHIQPLLDKYQNDYLITEIGTSELGEKISLIKIGNGPKIILGWSQMHGNEATTTKAIFDFLKFISLKTIYKKEIEEFLKQNTFYVIPMLNPDGAKNYTRENANGIDLNRDAHELSQKESQCLRKVFNELKPSLCLNFHDQRSIYGFENGNPATISFLSPAADSERSITDSRKKAMEDIVRMNFFLQQLIPGQVGRYDDSFNEACVGDTFQKAGVPTILFEAGHYKNDYQREKSREFIFYSILALFNIIDDKSKVFDYKKYFEIPENLKNYNDIIIRNYWEKRQNETQDIAIQYLEKLVGNDIEFIPIVEEIGLLPNKFGHREIILKPDEILTNSQENLTVGLNISKIIDNFKD